MRRTSPLLAAVLVLGALLGACSQQKDPKAAEMREDISEQLQEIKGVEGRPALNKEQADCYARLLVRNDADAKDFSDVKFSESEPSREDRIADRIAEAAIKARDDCDLAEAPR